MKIDRDWRLHNYCKDLVAEAMEELLRERGDVCTCNRCLCDIAAISLNQLTPKYVSSDRGEVFSRLEGMDQQYRCKVMAIVHGAIEKVKKNPRH